MEQMMEKEVVYFEDLSAVMAKEMAESRAKAHAAVDAIYDQSEREAQVRLACIEFVVDGATAH